MFFVVVVFFTAKAASLSWSIIPFKYLILQLFSSCLSSSPVFISPPLTDQYNQLWSPARASRSWIIDRGINLIRCGGGQRGKGRGLLPIMAEKRWKVAFFPLGGFGRNIKHQHGESKRNRKSDERVFPEWARGCGWKLFSSTKSLFLLVMMVGKSIRCVNNVIIDHIWINADLLI